MKACHQTEQPAAKVGKGQPEVDEMTTRLSNSNDLSEVVRSRNQLILDFTEKLIQRARELGESQKRIEEIRQIQLKKLILPEAALQSQSTPRNSNSKISKTAHMKSFQSRHEYFLRETEHPSYRELQIPTVAGSPSGPLGSSEQSKASSQLPPPSTPNVAFSTPSPSAPGTSLPTGENDGSRAALPSPALSTFSQRNPRYKCSLCPDLWFRDHFNLERHNQIHNQHHDHTPITCLRAWCSAEFLTKSDRKAHMEDCVWSCPEPLCNKTRMCYFWAFSILQKI